ncbi:C2H2 domain-containing protein [Polyplosphaeria fusca]|uniref:C2H2 domain-containing protein n=1 Tax=Polyplosphaeria fusca TaxID=682080 RepID=A0A9P4R020_9PLEO|nr:C2H2 domain-containing protein [Polyplosphaeria fusca]
MAADSANSNGDSPHDQTHSLPRSQTSETTFNGSGASTLIPSLDSRTSSVLDIPPFTQSSTDRGNYSSEQPCDYNKTSTRSTAFQAAYTKFRARLPGKQLDTFKTTTYEQLCQEIIRIQFQQESEKKMMNMSRIQGCLEAMHQFGKTIEIFLNVSDAVAFVWGPIKFLLLAASNHIDSFETLLEAYEQIGECLPLLSEYEALFHGPDMLHALELIYIDILDFHQHALRFFSGKFWTKFFRSVWKNFNTKFQGILNSLRRHKQLVETRASLMHFQRYEEDMAQFTRYQQDLNEIKSKMDQMIEEERSKKIKAIKEWLATGSQAAVDHERFLAVRQKYPNTGRWILKHETIDNWMHADVPATPLVWMNGIPGAGKTVLASIVVEELLQTIKQPKPPVVTYFYCNYNGNNSAVAIIRGILDQFIDQYPELMPHCHSRYSTSGEPGLRSFSLAKKLLEDFCLTIPKHFIVVDGLDECDVVERKQILELLAQIAADCDAEEPGKFRVLIVSQDYPDIRRALHTKAEAKRVPKVLSLTPNDNDKDIRVYVNDLAGQIKERHDLSDDQTEYLRNLTLNRAQGMFLYAKLVMPNLLKQPTREKLLREIQSTRFPNGLGEAYERIVAWIKNNTVDSEWEIAKTLLGWMVCAKRQLTLREVQVALALDVENQQIDYDEKRLRTNIDDICGSLVLLSGDRVQLVHSTAKQYVTKCTNDIHEASVECELASLCLQYLTFDCFLRDEDIEKKDLRRQALDGHFAFQDYAVAKWFYHVNAFVSLGGNLLKEGTEAQKLLDIMTTALDEFMSRYDEEDWDKGIVAESRKTCKVFEGYGCYDHLVALTSHIYTFQKKGFEARHIVSIKSLASVLERNRKLIEELPKKRKEKQDKELAHLDRYYDMERRFKCPKITCMYFSEGFKDGKARKKHVNVHDRPFQCEAPDCLGAECGFANSKDLEKHIRSFHPELSDLAESFKSANAPKAKAVWSCSMCGKSFTRNFHKISHERSHRGERPFECPECGKAFTRINDMKRHQKLHER